MSNAAAARVKAYLIAIGEVEPNATQAEIEAKLKEVLVRDFKKNLIRYERDNYQAPGFEMG